jgi:hypothetical protein
MKPAELIRTIEQAGCDLVMRRPAPSARSPGPGCCRGRSAWGQYGRGLTAGGTGQQVVDATRRLWSGAERMMIKLNALR